MIIGITGTNGAGKGTVVEFLIKKNFKHLSARKYLTKELETRGLEPNRENLIALGNELRAKNTPSYLAEQLFIEAKKSECNCIIESLRTPAEVEALRSKGDFVLLAIDADQKSRYTRVVTRGSATDKISFEEFVASEANEMTSTDPNKQNLSKCIELSDYKIENNGTIENLEQEMEKILNGFKKNN